MATRLRTLLVTYPLKPEWLVKDLASKFDLHFYPGRQGNDYGEKEPPPPSAEACAKAEILFTFLLPSNLTNWSQTPNLKLLQLVGAGADHVLRSEWYKSIPADANFTLATSSGIHVPQIGEHVIMLVTALYHKLYLSESIHRSERRWATPAELGGLSMQEIRGQTVGILGYGHLGRECARLFTTFGARIIAATRDGTCKPIGGFLVPGTGDHSGALPVAWHKTSEQASMDDFFKEADIVVDCLPGGGGNDKFIGERALCAMKDDALLINIGRGTTVDTDALVRALESTAERKGACGTLAIGGAGLDVTDPEPLPDGHPLFSLPNAIVTPHSSWMSKVNFVRSAQVLEANVDRMAQGMGALNALRGRGEWD